jgi:hypothetical protein
MQMIITAQLPQGRLSILRYVVTQKQVDSVLLFRVFCQNSDKHGLYISQRHWAVAILPK